MDENKQTNAKPTIDKEYLKKLAEKIKAEKARKESLSHKSDSTPTPPPISSISSKYLPDDDDEEIASEKTAIIDLSAFSGHSSDARLTIVDGKDAGKNIEITKDEILAGRSLDNDFVISDISVSRKHFKIVKENNHFVVNDLGSGNGIKVNGSKVTSAELSDGDIISVGARQIKFEILNPELKQTQQKLKKQTVTVDDDDSEEFTPKKGSSTVVWIIIAILIIIGGAVAYFVFAGSNQTPAQSESFVFGEKEKLAIEKMIDKKDLQNAEKAILDANAKTPGSNPYKLWLNERLVLIGKERTHQITFNNAKNIIQKNPEEAEKLLKSIPNSSIFSDDAKNLLTMIPKTEQKVEKKEETKAEQKKEESKKADSKKAESKKAESKKNVTKKSDSKKAESKKKEPKVEPKKEEPKEEIKEEIKEEPKAEPKTEEPKTEEPKAEPKKDTNKKKAATMSEEDAKKLYMEANAMKDDDPEAAKELLKKIIDSVDPESKRYKKAKELLEKL